ncbi:replication initiation factor domain-containing protein [Ferrimonas pelagia]|uniref:Replication initiation protein-like C-terminal domain-containing protein n=1 Tax=Ferrimonas pelagia TaxID=1177826 RepID=A0ABP9F2A6_9GAMM
MKLRPTKQVLPIASIDYLTFTWCPQELYHIKELARIGVMVQSPKDRREFESPMCQKHWDKQYHQQIDELAHEELARKLKVENFAATGLPYYEALDALCEHFGYGLIDSVCRGAIDEFIDHINLGLSTRYDAQWTVRKNDKGRFQYPYSANLKIGEAPAGLICWGGSNLGCMVSLTGTGCQSIDMRELYHLIRKIPAVKITRVDIAHDDKTGKRSIDWAKQQAENSGLGKGFMLSNKPPRYTYIESGHMQGNGKAEVAAGLPAYKFTPDLGRSFYVGARSSGKLYRAYEKGKQLGDTGSPWVRHELELRNQDRIIPLEVLLKPSQYFAGAYPCMAFLNEVQHRVETIRRNTRITFEKAVEHGAKQMGRLVNCMKQVGMSSDQILERLTRHLDEHEIPKRLLMPMPPPEPRYKPNGFTPVPG